MRKAWFCVCWLWLWPCPWVWDVCWGCCGWDCTPPDDRLVAGAGEDESFRPNFVASPEYGLLARLSRPGMVAVVPGNVVTP